MRKQVVKGLEMKQLTHNYGTEESFHISEVSLHVGR